MYFTKENVNYIMHQCRPHRNAFMIIIHTASLTEASMSTGASVLSKFHSTHYRDSLRHYLAVALFRGFLAWTEMNITHRASTLAWRRGAGDGLLSG